VVVPVQYHKFREIASPLSLEMLAPLPPDIGRVQFAAVLHTEDYRKLAQLLQNHPTVALRVYSDYKQTITDLEFLRHFSELQGFSLDLWHLTDFTGLRHLGESLARLGLSSTKTKTLSLRFLEQFPRLNSLGIGGHTKDFDAVSTRVSLHDLSLAALKLADLSAITPLLNLRDLSITGGSLANLDLLPEVQRLESLTLRQVRGVADLSAVAEAPCLKTIWLERLPHVNRLPTLTKCRELSHVRLWSMKGLTDLAALADAPALEELEIANAPVLEPQDFRCLVGHPHLRKVNIALGSDVKNNAVAKLLGIPGRYGKLEIK
jgi:hypothetical protein